MKYKIGTVIAWFYKKGKPFDIDIILAKDFFDTESFISQSLLNYKDLEFEISDGGFFKINFNEETGNHKILFYWEV